METIENLLGNHAFFRGLEPDDLKLIAGCASNVHFKPDSYLSREGERADRFFAIRKGTIAVEINVPDRGPVTIQTMSEGDVFGWSWLFPPFQWQFDTRAQNEVSATAFDGACLRKKCDEDPRLGYDLMQRLARLVVNRLAATRLQLLDIYGNSRHT